MLENVFCKLQTNFFLIAINFNVVPISFIFVTLIINCLLIKLV